MAYFINEIVSCVRALIIHAHLSLYPKNLIVTWSINTTKRIEEAADFEVQQK